MCEEAHKARFGVPIRDQDKTWAPHFACEHCKRDGIEGKSRAMKFAISRIWREPTDHSTDCIFCMVDPSKRRSGKNAAAAVLYPDIPSSIAPVPHSANLPVPAPPERSQLSEESSKSEDEQNRVEDCNIADTAVVGRNPYYPNQRDLNDFI
ncbi:uncharacterized protein LOC143025418 [Oratosquilla oratoria]|uniref:uncharacterized protein LOC143025418 n=1 Tax=Oratosquilla oratoria TaxID=337810 RepID=UPI003F75A909